MAYSSRPTSMLPSGPSTSLRQPSHVTSHQQSSALAARISAKRAELESLNQLRDMSSVLATQMETLQSKLETLKDGTEAVACVLANWDNVLRAITMASTKIADVKGSPEQGLGSESKENAFTEALLPSTLVRIPVAQEGNQIEG